MKLKLRRATLDDMWDVLAWRNDPHTVAMSKTPELVEKASHLQWFSKAIEDPDRRVLIAEEYDQKLGMIRFDRTGNAWAVSINMAPEVRGRGYGRTALAAAINMLRAEVGPCKIEAEVKDVNRVSLRLFEGLGFDRQGFEGGFHVLALLGRLAS